MKLPHRRQFLYLAAGASSFPTLSRIACAQAYPTRRITFVNPAAAGGPIDVVARVIGDRMRVTLGQPILVENVTGGVIGVVRAARAAPDGYTVSVGNWSTHVSSAAIYPALSNILTDFDPVALLASNPMVIVSKKTVPASNLQELMAWLRTNQGTVSVGTAGIGSAPHLMGIYFQNAIGAHFQFVPYRGVAPAMNDLVSGQIDLMIDQTSSAMPQVRAGNIRGYAVTAKSRISLAPEIPTVDEAGATGLHMSIWFGLWVPRRTPKDIIARINAAAVEAMADQNVRSRFRDLGLEVPPADQQTPETLGALQKADIEKWLPIIKAAGIKAE
jgi:tripartite-type tricarboxylate transporter receptor subunit TctC